ncbi:MAG: hypothetical protein QOF62_1646 [Pyrinomonadaceae bacterium]|jgi:hypothetical protein|nr:hypothetical protein [Pyrinomonadaceae bacterium]
MIKLTDDLRKEFVEIIKEGRSISAEIGTKLEELLQDGLDHSLSREETSRLLTRTFNVLKELVVRRKDKAAIESLTSKLAEIMDRVLMSRDSITMKVESPSKIADNNGAGATVELAERNGIQPGPVFPTPCFNETEVPMRAGFIKTSDIKLWPKNERLDLHLKQFQHRNGRGPSHEELLDLMLSRMDLPGLLEVPEVSSNKKTDQFEIVKLARSIANNGVRKPPIIDIDGTLLDGNRRVTASWYVLNSDEFDLKQKLRAEYIFAWQLTEHTTDEQREAVVVSLNFEDDCKEPWPDYVRARKVYEEWEGLLQLETRSPSPQKQAQLKKELSRKFALGPDTSTVNRYLKMMAWAIDFEDYQINEKGRDEFEVKHRVARYFQYFDELSSGITSGVAYTLGRDDEFKHLVFDLLYGGKFKNWRQIRELKVIYENAEARQELENARKEVEPKTAQVDVEAAILIAKSNLPKTRTLGANTRIESFVKWLEELPVKAFRDDLRPENLKRLLKALKLVEKHASTILEQRNEVSS